MLLQAPALYGGLNYYNTLSQQELLLRSQKINKKFLLNFNHSLLIYDKGFPLREK